VTEHGAGRLRGKKEKGANSRDCRGRGREKREEGPERELGLLKKKERGGEALPGFGLVEGTKEKGRVLKLRDDLERKAKKGEKESRCRDPHSCVSSGMGGEQERRETRKVKKGREGTE